MRKLHQKSQI